MDKKRADYIRHYFYQNPAHPHHYDVVINVENYSNEQVAEMIISAIEIKFNAPRPKQPKKDSFCGEQA